MGYRLDIDPFDGRPADPGTRSTARRLRIAPVLVALICALLAIASVTVGQPKVDAPAIIG